MPSERPWPNGVGFKFEFKIPLLSVWRFYHEYFWNLTLYFTPCRLHMLEVCGSKTPSTSLPTK